MEPDQEFSLRFVKCQAGLVAAQSAAPLQGHEGNQVVLPELDIVGALLLLRVLAVDKIIIKSVSQLNISYSVSSFLRSSCSA